MWSGLLLLLSLVISGLDNLGSGSLLDKISVDLVAQIVPATVIAIFVFAVGVAFVVAQVVPPARGTRADGALRDLRLTLTISPAPAFILGSAFLVSTGEIKELAASLLLGAVLYIAGSVISMLSILDDATDPSQFRALLVARAVRSISKLTYTPATAASPDRPERARRVTRSKQIDDDHGSEFCFDLARVTQQQPRNPTDPDSYGFASEQRATDALYDIVRTLRGWARVSASTGDSRELHESLDALLSVVDSYSRQALPSAHWVATLPTAHWSHVTERPELSPLFNLARGQSQSLASSDHPWPDWADPWAPGMLATRFRPARSDVPQDAKPSGTANCAQVQPLGEKSVLPTLDVVLPPTWLANEVGRAIVRAVEFGVDAGGLLERDIGRLLNTLENATVIFHGAALETAAVAQGNPTARNHEWSAGVLIKYLTEVGLGVRRCPADYVSWFYEPCVRLLRLHRHFVQRPASPLDFTSTAKGLLGRDRLAIGAAAGVLRVGDAMISAHERLDTSGNEAAARVSALKKALAGGNEDSIRLLTIHESDQLSVVALTCSEDGPLSTNDHREVYPSDRDRVMEILKALSVESADLRLPAGRRRR